MPKTQDYGSLFAVADTMYLKYRTPANETGKRIHKTIKLCVRSKELGYDWKFKKDAKGRRKLSPSKPIEDLQSQRMDEINSTLVTGVSPISTGMTFADFWTTVYLPYCYAPVPAKGRATRHHLSTIKNYVNIWEAHLEPHLGSVRLVDYTPDRAKKLLLSLKDTHGENSLKHVRALARHICHLAVEKELIKTNPWHAIQLPDGFAPAPRPRDKRRYTSEERETMLKALAVHKDCALIVALSTYLGLRPSETGALRWQDFAEVDGDTFVTIDRAVVHGVVDTTKTVGSQRELPLGNVRPYFEAYRAEVLAATNGRLPEYLFPSSREKLNLKNTLATVIVPHIKGGRCRRCDKEPKSSGVEFKGLYAGRRQAITEAIMAVDNVAFAQHFAGHDEIKTTMMYLGSMPKDQFRELAKQLTTAQKG